MLNLTQRLNSTGLLNDVFSHLQPSNVMLARNAFEIHVFYSFWTALEIHVSYLSYLVWHIFNISFRLELSVQSLDGVSVYFKRGPFFTHQMRQLCSLIVPGPLLCGEWWTVHWLNRRAGWPIRATMILELSLMASKSWALLSSGRLTSYWTDNRRAKAVKWIS